MAAQLQVDRVEECATWLESNAEKYEQVQSIAVLIEDMGVLCKALAFINNQKAVAKRELNQAKVKVYNNLIASQRAVGFTISPMLAKDYVSAQLVLEQYNYDICDRTSATIVHTIDSLRTCISALKEEVRAMMVGGQ